MITKRSTDISASQFVAYTDKIICEVEKAVIGKEEVLRKMLATFLVGGGHVLIEDYPGLAKTLIANSFATVLGLDFKRIQFTPDLLPGDITGGYVFDIHQQKFELRKGPIFTNLLLADEINRASPKTQSALLEAMQENQVTLEGEKLSLPVPFLVVATENPIEYEGTFPLPEAQMDRFLIKIKVGYPTREEEKEILERRQQRKSDSFSLNPIISPAIFLQMRQLIEGVFIHTDLEQYIVDLVTATRFHHKVAIGSSPRGSLALFKLSKAWAAMQGRSFVLPDDIKLFTQETLSHRIMLEPGLWETKIDEQSILEEITNSTSIPVIQDQK